MIAHPVLSNQLISVNIPNSGFLSTYFMQLLGLREYLLLIDSTEIMY